MGTNPSHQHSTSQKGLTIPAVEELGTAVRALRRWQADGAVWQLHPGDIGWYSRNGPEATADAVRIWTKDGTVVAVGLLDGAQLLRLTTAPDARQDADLARRLAADISAPETGVLPPGDPSLHGSIQRIGLHAVIEYRRSCDLCHCGLRPNALGA